MTNKDSTDVRKSSRATKGQHPKAHELDQPIETKKKGKKGGKKAAVQEEEVEVIRCVCGVTSTTDDDEDAWIACDICGVWQHNICVGISPFEEDTPDKYTCEQCAPDAHKELLDGISRGEQPWIARREKHAEEKAEQERKEAEDAARKRGKKGKKRQSGSGSGTGSTEQKRDVTPANGKLQSPSVSTKKEPQKESPTKGASQKRKARDESQDKEVAKVRSQGHLLRMTLTIL